MYVHMHPSKCLHKVRLICTYSTLVIGTQCESGSGHKCGTYTPTHRVHSRIGRFVEQTAATHIHVLIPEIRTYVSV